ncbi:glycosyl transferas-like protein [Lindgomyces ingoldianus]|uniref:Glycosyl transferas-like protein n=1 Tax=Lindgomyces ingoldianus TaxID=673940 RepID=A0ACB6QBK8_9PLEO|nr:glycosyl transferas-like protein [Lindgomyces ingoldianus]KAF2464429.1 glycosyl transferas-like protein [Lindgomyces ingoldianus]
MATTSTHLVVSVAFQDAGDATRAIAIAVALRESCPLGHDLKITFLSCGSRFEHLITSAGFEIVACQPRVKGRSVAHDLGWDFPEFFGSEQIAKTFIDGQLEAFRSLRPDAVFHGMWAPASIAARLLGIRTINFLPVPLHPSSFTNGLIRDLPDMMPLFTRLPRPIRQKLAWWGSGLMILFHADYSDRLPRNIAITGPLFAKSDAELDADIVAHMRKGPGPAILVTMGSSGTEEFLFEAIRAFTMSPNDDWNIVVLASPSICSPDEARAVAGNDPRLLVTDRFIPALKATALADVAVIHGGQGTVQTAMAAGTPIVGVALQIEQQTNLDNAMNAGVGIRVQRQHWNPKAIREAVQKVQRDASYRSNARALAEKINDMDGAKVAADCMWNFLLKDEEKVPILSYETKS